MPKWCTNCGVQKPLCDFDRDINNEDGYKNTCKVCRAALRIDQKEPLDPRIAAIEEESLNKLSQLSTGGTLSPESKDVVDAFFRAVGGVDGFIRRLNAQYYAATPGSSTRTKIDLAIITLITKLEPNTGELKTLSIDELQALLRREARAIMDRKPAPLVIDAAPTQVDGVTA